MKNIYLALTTILAIVLFSYSCLKPDAPDPTMDLQPASQISMAMAPCDSVYYLPVTWGSELKVVKNTITHRDRRPYGKSSQGMVFANTKLLPTNYLQDWLKERIVICDRDTMLYTDTFYICRKFKK